MADNTPIEWTDATWNPVTGCEVVSPGCTNCYAMRLAGTRMKHHPSREGLTRDSKGGPVWTGAVRLNDAWLDQPLRWKKPRRIFVCAHGDLFAESVPDAWIDRVFAVMALAPQHTFQVLTKRAERMRQYLSNDHSTIRIHQQMRYPLVANADAPSLLVLQRNMRPLPNVWLGVSVEDQPRADERIPHLLGTPAAKRFVSAEPLLGPTDLTRVGRPLSMETGVVNALTGEWATLPIFWRGGNTFLRTGAAPRLDWVIAGGESGPNARPMHPDWARSLRDQCAAAGVPFFFKQWGAWLPDRQSCDPTPYGNANTGHRFDDGVVAVRLGKKAAGRHLDGRTWDQFPE